MQNTCCTYPDYQSIRSKLEGNCKVDNQQFIPKLTDKIPIIELKKKKTNTSI